jgi:predicted PurR-regulated permease PerM
MNSVSILNFPTTFIRAIPWKLKFSFKILFILSLVLVITLLTFYIFQINDLTSKAYQVQNSQKKINDLSSENETLEIELSKSNSLVNIETLIQEFNFEKAAKIHYIQISENQIVKE